MSVDSKRFTLATPYRAGIASLAVGVGAVETTVPQVQAKTNYKPSATTTMKTWQPPSRLKIDPGSLYKGGATWGSGGAPGGSGGAPGGSGGAPGGSGGPGGAPGGSGGPGAPPGTPGAAPVTAFLPDTSSPRGNSGQQQYVSQNVNVPVNVNMAPTSSYTVGPSARQDYGAMVPSGVGEGFSSFLGGKCIQYALIGALAAYLMNRRG